ncbi:glycoside hydrolase family 2 TIM barrel-domain containing protein [Sediminicola luteus]|uniref:Glycosidase n=1 Tax=Sediminicola luteus TaxID=319238 RepID=A0A2A4GAM0_9FLAO|nr:glycoside hydrolase family 2 TIM barrel-domain containing protein [Sediminicola luteus]PCE64805.1 glycosidase [Sediminicola luteus]
MKNSIIILCLLLGISVGAQSSKVSLVNDQRGTALLVEGRPFMVNGMNWDYFPIGTNYNYSLWKQSDAFIKNALDNEMALLRNMGVNAIRQYTGVPPKWITYIYDNYGIYTMLNHSFGRYGLTIDGTWMANTEYADPRVKQLLLKETTQLAKTYKNTRGLLLFLLGNENNYGLFWEGAETEDIPIQDRKSTERARAMYKLFNEAAIAMKAIDTGHPIALCNGDLLFLDIIAQECPDVDVFGTNMYRGISFGDAFERVKNEYGKPILFTEFGSDAFNALTNKEDQMAQAHYMVGNWKEIYANAAGLGKSQNSLGGFTFQFSDGWWKYGQTKNLDVHDTNASWANGGYTFDHKEGQNNMNEEWFGICAKGQTDAHGYYELYPRAAYYALKEVHDIDPFAYTMRMETLDSEFAEIELIDAVIQARGDKAAMVSEKSSAIRIGGLRAEFTTFTTGGNLITTPEDADPNNETTFPNKQGFDHMESYYVDVEASPTEGFNANVSFNILGNVATNPINEIFYENRGRTRTVETDNGDLALTDLNRVQVYQSEFEWQHQDFNFKGFYRTGHYHWGYEGDFFGLYPEANYGPNLDLYNGEAPFGFEFEGKKSLSGLKIAAGPELWWGANPAFLVKYSTALAKIDLTGIYHEDVDDAEQAQTSIAIPQPKTRRLTLHAKREFGDLALEVGGIWGGEPLVGREYSIVRQNTDGSYTELTDVVESSDTWGGKVKISYSGGKFNWYGQAAAIGLVAFGGADQTKTFTGWRLKDSGSGNQYNFLTGFTYSVGNLQIAPNFLWQKPLVDPIPFDAPIRKRNIIDDPFAVRANRETVAGEILLTFDPTPATWFYEWDNDYTEDATFAASLGFVYRHLPTSQDAAIGFDDTGRNPIAFPLAPPAEDLWELHGRVVSKLTRDFGFIINFYTGTAQPNAWGTDPGDAINRTITRYGTDLRAIYKKMKFIGAVKVDDWGPFDYHRDFNLTFPLQLTADLSTTVGKPDWFILPNTRLGIRYTWRSLDQYSPRYLYQGALDQGFGQGEEWEIRTYIHINIGK